AVDIRGRARSIGGRSETGSQRAGLGVEGGSSSGRAARWCEVAGGQVAGVRGSCGSCQVIASRCAGIRQGIKGGRVCRHTDQREDVCMLIERLREKELVFPDRTIHRKSVNLAQVLGLEWVRYVGIRGRIQGREGGLFVERGPLALAVRDVKHAVETICSALGHRVDDAAGGAAELCSVDTCIYLELTYRACRCGVSFTRASAFFRKVRLIVVRTVDQHRVEDIADTAHADKTEARGTVHYTRRQHGERG